MGKTKNSFDVDAYTTFKDEKQKMFDEFVNENCFFAFSNEQFKEGQKKLEEKLGYKNFKITSFFNGGFVLSNKYDELIRIVNDSEKKLYDKLGDNDFTRGAFLYELRNHEYSINYQGDYDVVSIFTNKELVFDDYKNYVDYLCEAGYESDVIKAFEEAVCEYYAEQDSLDESTDEKMLEELATRYGFRECDYTWLDSDILELCYEYDIDPSNMHYIEAHDAIDFAAKYIDEVYCGIENLPVEVLKSCFDLNEFKRRYLSDYKEFNVKGANTLYLSRTI